MIPGSPSATYTPTTTDAAHRISCEVTVTYPLLAVTVSAASAPVVIPPVPVTPKVAVRGMTLRIGGSRTVTRGGRATFTYRVKNTTSAAITGVVVTNTLPKGLRIDATSRRANLRVKKKPLRFTGGGRTITFRLGAIAKGRTVLVKVNAKVAAQAATGRRTNTAIFWAKGVGRVKTTSRVTIR